MTELFDTHCHIHAAEGSEGEKATRERWSKAETTAAEIVQRATSAGVTRLLCVGCSLDDSRLAVKFAQSHSNCWAAVGIHPHEAGEGLGQDLKAAFEELTQQPKVIGIGECGLDYFYNHSPKSTQENVLRMQIECAMEHRLPLVFHVREAFDDFWPIFESYHNKAHPLRGVLHSFTDSQTNLDRALRHNLYIGINGIATFTKKPEQLEVYRRVPIEKLVLETDAPFLTPHPYRGKMCEPYHMRATAEFLANLRGETIETIDRTTTLNARQLFNV